MRIIRYWSLDYDVKAIISLNLHIDIGHSIDWWQKKQKKL